MIRKKPKTNVKIKIEYCSKCNRECNFIYMKQGDMAKTPDTIGCFILYGVSSRTFTQDDLNKEVVMKSNVSC